MKGQGFVRKYSANAGSTHKWSLFIGVVIVAMAQMTDAAEPWNILFIHMEDMGTEIPAYGDHTVATPNLDRLAEEGVVFNKAYVTAATCAASRGSLFSGLYPHQNGVMGFVKNHGFYLRPSIPTFVRDLKEAGYATGITYKDGIESKHYDGNKPVPFDYHPGYTENSLKGMTGKKAPTIKNNPPLASNAVDNFRYFLENMEAGKPFYFQAQTPDTHHIWDRPWFIRDGDPGWPYPPVDTTRIKSVPGWGDAIKPADGLLKSIAEYYSAIQRVDWYVGRILALLEEYGYADNTLVIFSADHGPSHFIKGKTTPYELGLQVPFIVRWPGQVKNPGTHSDALVSFVDLYPTFVEAAGLDIPDHLPGYSLLPVLKGEAPRRQHAYSAYVAHTTGIAQYWPTRTVTDGRYKLTHNLLGDGKRNRYAVGKLNSLPSLIKHLGEIPDDSLAKELAQRTRKPPKFELYDLENDPHEQVNLFGKPEHSASQKRLMARLSRWQEAVSDPFRDQAFLEHFSAVYKKNTQLFKSLGAKKMKDPKALDFSEFIQPWDPSPYAGKKDL
jgi:N-sulfoglucosamine sulfohydrolase